MELKYNNQLGKSRANQCSNCTFMELKLVKECILRKELKVLIVPLWN